MTKILDSPSKHWPGKVYFADPLSFPQLIAYSDALAASSEIKASGEKDPLNIKTTFAILPGVLACIEKFELQGFPDLPGIDEFPATPMEESAELIAWLIKEISKLANQAKEPVPNE